MRSGARASGHCGRCRHVWSPGNRSDLGGVTEFLIVLLPPIGSLRLASHHGPAPAPGRGGSVGGPGEAQRPGRLPAHLRATVLFAFVIRPPHGSGVKNFAEASCLPPHTGVGRCRDRLCRGVPRSQVGDVLPGLGDHPKIAETKAASGSASSPQPRTDSHPGSRPQLLAWPAPGFRLSRDLDGGSITCRTSTRRERHAQRVAVNRVSAP
jgi:hypothetical protein